MTTTAATARLAARQGERRQRILDSTLELAAEGGYDAVQMREAAARAGVSLGTLYRYFRSKDALLAAAWSHWAARIEPQLMRRPIQGTTMAERSYDFLRRTTRAFERSPNLASAVLIAANSNDPSSAQQRREASDLLGRLLESTMDALDETTAADIRAILDHVWNSALHHWVSGRCEMGQVYETLDRACHLLLDPRET